MIATYYPDDKERGNAMGIALGGLALGVLGKFLLLSTFFLNTHACTQTRRHARTHTRIHIRTHTRTRTYTLTQDSEEGLEEHYRMR